jgi:hypothetical protein
VHCGGKGPDFLLAKPICAPAAPNRLKNPPAHDDECYLAGIMMASGQKRKLLASGGHSLPSKVLSLPAIKSNEILMFYQTDVQSSHDYVLSSLAFPRLKFQL